MIMRHSIQIFGDCFMYRTARKFFSDRSGVIAIKTALLIVPLLAVVGVAIDYGRIANSETKLDRALLFSKNMGGLEGENYDAHKNQISALINQNYNGKNVSLTYTTTGGEILIEARDIISTPFLSFIGTKEHSIVAYEVFKVETSLLKPFESLSFDEKIKFLNNELAKIERNKNNLSPEVYNSTVLLYRNHLEAIRQGNCSFC